jgi:hypothetical protein
VRPGKTGLTWIQLATTYVQQIDYVTLTTSAACSSMVLADQERFSDELLAANLLQRVGIPTWRRCDAGSVLDNMLDECWRIWAGLG